MNLLPLPNRQWNEEEIKKGIENYKRKEAYYDLLAHSARFALAFLGLFLFTLLDF